MNFFFKKCRQKICGENGFRDICGIHTPSEIYYVSDFMQHFALGQTKAKLGICIFGKIKLEGNNIGIVVNRNIVSRAPNKKATLNAF